MVVGTLSLAEKGQTSGCSMQWMQWNSGIWWWGHCLSCKKVKPEDAVDAVCVGFDLFALKVMVPTTHICKVHFVS